VLLIPSSWGSQLGALTPHHQELKSFFCSSRPLSYLNPHRAARSDLWVGGLFRAEQIPHRPTGPIAVAGAPIRPASTVIYSGRWGRCGSKTGLPLAAFPSESLLRHHNCSPPTATLSLPAHRSETRLPTRCWGAPQSAVVGVTSAVVAYHAAAFTRRRRWSDTSPMYP
jgi:hypothetical protein